MRQSTVCIVLGPGRQRINVWEDNYHTKRLTKPYAKWSKLRSIHKVQTKYSALNHLKFFIRLTLLSVDLSVVIILSR